MEARRIDRDRAQTTLCYMRGVSPGRPNSIRVALSVAVALAFGSQASAGAIVEHGLTMPPGSQQVGESRYRVPLKYNETIDFFGKHKGFEPRRIISQPGIRAINLKNYDGAPDWESINIYEKDGEVRVYVIARPPPVKKERRKDSTKAP